MRDKYNRNQVKRWKAVLCERTVDNVVCVCPALRGAVIHSDRGTQYTSKTYRKAAAKYSILQSMNSAGGHCWSNDRDTMYLRMLLRHFVTKYPG